MIQFDVQTQDLLEWHLMAFQQILYLFIMRKRIINDQTEQVSHPIANLDLQVLKNAIFDNLATPIFIQIIIRIKGMLPLTCFLLLLFPALSSAQIHQLPTSISNPHLFDVCQDHSVIVVANDQKIEILTRKNKHFQSQTIIIPSGGVAWLKCMKRGFIAIASSDSLCLYNISSSQQKCKNFTGTPISISEQIQTDQQFLLIASSRLQLSEMVYHNYTQAQKSTIISAQINIEKASYVANHQFIYTVDQLSNLAIYAFPYHSAPISREKIKEVFPIDSISTFRNINAALLSNRVGDFALIQDGEFVRAWTETSYTRGCLCSKEKVTLANNKNIAIYDSDDQVRVIEGFRITGELKGILCSFSEEHHKLHLLDGQGKIIIIQLQEHQARPSLYILIFLVLIIAALAIKFIWFPSHQQMLSTDFDDASKQDREHAYRQLKEIKGQNA